MSYTQQEVKEVFDRAISRLRTGWCQLSDARKFADEPCEWDDPDAETWSLESALMLSAIESGASARNLNGSWDVDPTMWSLILQATGMTTYSMRAYNNEYSLRVEEVIRKLEKARDRIRYLGLPTD